MRQLSFTQEEITLLISVLKQSEVNNEAVFKEQCTVEFRPTFEKMFLNPLRLALRGILKSNTNIFSKNEKEAIIRSILEYELKLKEQIDLKNALFWLNLSEEQKQAVLHLDNCKDILNKCGYYRKKNVMGTINTLVHLSFLSGYLTKVL